MWEDMCRVLGRPDLLTDARFVTMQDRNRHRTELIAELDAAFKAKDADEWVALLRGVGVPVGPINTIDRALAEPQVLHRDMVMALAGDDPDQRARVAGNPIKLRRAARTRHRYPPRLGQDTRSVLADRLGYTPERISDLIERKVVGVPGTLDKTSPARGAATAKAGANAGS